MEGIHLAVVRFVIAGGAGVDLRAAGWVRAPDIEAPDTPNLVGWLGVVIGSRLRRTRRQRSTPSPPSWV
ncbi:MAG: hypothetical protein M3265_00920 [Actinomycetota bacterium]|nr:hypothetical protein [Actinomycetota bacterium]